MVVSRLNQQFQTTLNLSPVSFTEQKLPSAQGLGLGKPWEPNWRLQFEETNASMHSEAVQVQHA